MDSKSTKGGRNKESKMHKRRGEMEKERIYRQKENGVKKIEVIDIQQGNLFHPKAAFW